MTRIGVMQGRLVSPYGNRIQCFPKDNWAQEFDAARMAGLDAIEWILDTHGLDQNPLASQEGLGQVQTAVERSGVAVRSLCADYFMEYPLLRATPAELEVRLQMLRELMGRCRILGIGRIVIPFVDASRIDLEEELQGVQALLAEALKDAETTGVEIHLETSLAPSSFAALLDRLPHPLLKVNYDSGNSASLGYLPRDEFAAYGSRVGSVHIKDRLFKGGSVPLGTGHVDFPSLWEALTRVDYRGDFILQVARGTAGEEILWAQNNAAFVREQLHAYGIGSYASES